jgi:hypothetical protein
MAVLVLAEFEGPSVVSLCVDGLGAIGEEQGVLEHGRRRNPGSSGSRAAAENTNSVPFKAWILTDGLRAPEPIERRRLATCSLV